LNDLNCIVQEALVLPGAFAGSGNFATITLNALDR
jgi:hypothetical protein